MSQFYQFIDIVYKNKTFTIAPQIISSQPPSPPTFDCIIAAIKRVCGVQVEVVYYDDDEGERVTVKTEEELREAYGLAPNPIIFVEKDEKSYPPVRRVATAPPITAASQPYYTETTSNDILPSIQQQLAQLIQRLNELTTTKQTHQHRIQREAQFEKEIEKLEKSWQQVVLENDNKKQSIVSLNLNIQKLQNEIDRKKDEIQRASLTNQQLTSNLQQLSRNLSTSKEATSKLGIQLHSKMKQYYELKSRYDANCNLEEKLVQLRKELDSKNEHNLQMSKQLLDIRAETVAFEKKSKLLEQQLVQEQNEIQTLQQSFFTLQNSTTTAVLATRFGEFGDVTSVVPSEIMQSMNKPAIPQDISAVDLEILTAMGHNDLQKNIALLRQYKNADTVIEVLTKGGV